MGIPHLVKNIAKGVFFLISKFAPPGIMFKNERASTHRKKENITTLALYCCQNNKFTSIFLKHTFCIIKHQKTLIQYRSIADALIKMQENVDATLVCKLNIYHLKDNIFSVVVAVVCVCVWGGGGGGAVAQW